MSNEAVQGVNLRNFLCVLKLLLIHKLHWPLESRHIVQLPVSHHVTKENRIPPKRQNQNQFDYFVYVKSTLQ